MEELPFYVGLYLTNTGTLGIGKVNHHLYNWGNVGLFMGIGRPEQQVVLEEGAPKWKRYLPIGITADERVCSGAHYAALLRDLNRFLAHPEVLETEPAEVRFDRGCEYHQPKPGESR
jgi:pyruvate/2-oxoglutarate dehydrogenase complex dihydrolipoamide acyltransferase (E2) component